MRVCIKTKNTYVSYLICNILTEGKSKKSLVSLEKSLLLKSVNIFPTFAPGQHTGILFQFL